jgi:hypothetical protein
MGIHRRSVLSIHAILERVHSHITCPSPHSVSRCDIVSFLPHCMLLVESVNRILCRHALVGIRSWITVYRADLAHSNEHDVLMCLQTVDHAIAAWGCMTLITRSKDSALDICRRVQCALRLKALSVSSCRRGVCTPVREHRCIDFPVSLESHLRVKDWTGVSADPSDGATLSSAIPSFDSGPTT